MRVYPTYSTADTNMQQTPQTILRFFLHMRRSCSIRNRAWSLSMRLSAHFKMRTFVVRVHGEPKDHKMQHLLFMSARKMLAERQHVDRVKTPSVKRHRVTPLPNTQPVQVAPSTPARLDSLAHCFNSAARPGTDAQILDENQGVAGKSVEKPSQSTLTLLRGNETKETTLLSDFTQPMRS